MDALCLEASLRVWLLPAGLHCRFLRAFLIRQPTVGLSLALGPLTPAGLSLLRRPLPRQSPSTTWHSSAYFVGLFSVLAPSSSAQAAVTEHPRRGALSKGCLLLAGLEAGSLGQGVGRSGSGFGPSSQLSSCGPSGSSQRPSPSHGGLPLLLSTLTSARGPHPCNLL